MRENNHNELSDEDSETVTGEVKHSDSSSQSSQSESQEEEQSEDEDQRDQRNEGSSSNQETPQYMKAANQKKQKDRQKYKRKTDSSLQDEEDKKEENDQEDELEIDDIKREGKHHKKNKKAKYSDEHSGTDHTDAGGTGIQERTKNIPDLESLGSQRFQNLPENEKLRRMQSFVRLRTEVFKVSTSQTIKSFEAQKNQKVATHEELQAGKKICFGKMDMPGENGNEVSKKKFSNKVRTQRYTIFTWAPLSLLFQFKRVSNIYFLIISILTFFPISPKNPASMVATFALVLFFTMLKEAYEDFQRYKQDKEVNNKLTTVLNQTTLQWEVRKWEEIEPGNIIKFKKDHEVPADIAIISSANKNGVVYVDTMNLDGETNLKEKNALIEHFSEEQLDQLTGEIRCELPNENLEKWDAQIFYRSRSIKTSIADIKNLLLRGCFVRNTIYGIGIVVYTGMDTKIMRNLKKPPHKVSNIMKLINKMLYTVFIFQLILIALFAGLNVMWTNQFGKSHSYIDIDTSQSEAVRFFLQLLTFWVAYSHMIPISLYVIIEILKLGQASYINKDVQMYDQETLSFARCRNSDLIEELGQVEMIFSDKTGTLTQNKMILKKCQINGIRYGELRGNERDNSEGITNSGVKDIVHQLLREKHERGEETEGDENENVSEPDSKENDEVDLEEGDDLDDHESNGDDDQDQEENDDGEESRDNNGPQGSESNDEEKNRHRRKNDYQKTNKTQKKRKDKDSEDQFIESSKEKKHRRQYEGGDSESEEASRYKYRQKTKHRKKNQQKQPKDSQSIVEVVSENEQIYKVQNKKKSKNKKRNRVENQESSNFKLNQFSNDEMNITKQHIPYSYATSFFELMALCNTVICDHTNQGKKVQYKASSPDELALALGSKQCGIKLVDREHDRVTIFNQLTNRYKTYKVIAEFPFDSIRKRMSVIVKDDHGAVKILVKGADSVMLDRISYEKNGIDDLKQVIEEDLYYYSCEGLRTLMMAERHICKEEYNQFKLIYEKLQQSSAKDKEEKLLALFDAMEQKLRYLGCSAIEDKLQEGVAATIEKLMQAKIRFFMLTGDKLETAIEIAKSCQIIQEGMKVHLLGKPKKDKIYSKMNSILSQMRVNLDQPVKSIQDVELFNQVITIEGATLAVAIEDEELNEMFFHLAIRSRSIVCCRMSPKQKADVVNIFKRRGKWITLAIGDGANDVTMIMEAHIGVGIKGKEGTQAVRSADFAICQFQFLMRLLLYQGRNGYLRVSQMICYYFYKNIVLVFTEFYFAIFTGYSGQIFFLDWLPMLYNAIFTSWHCLFATLLEKDVNEHYSYKYPSIYRAGQLGLYFNYAIFWKWIILALWHGAVCYYTPIIMGMNSNSSDGRRGEHWLYSTISFTVIIHLVFYKLLLEIRHFNSLSFFSGVLSLLVYYACVLLFQIPDLAFLLQPQLLGLLQQMVFFPHFWIILVAAPLACLVPDIVIKVFSRVAYPTPVDKVLHQQKKHPEYHFSQDHELLEQTLQNRKRQNLPKAEEREQEIEKRRSSFTMTKKPAKQEQYSGTNFQELEIVEEDEQEEQDYTNQMKSGNKMNSRAQYSESHHSSSTNSNQESVKRQRGNEDDSKGSDDQDNDSSDQTNKRNQSDEDQSSEESSEAYDSKHRKSKKLHKQKRQKQGQSESEENSQDHEDPDASSRFNDVSMRSDRNLVNQRIKRIEEKILEKQKKKKAENQKLEKKSKVQQTKVQKKQGKKFMEDKSMFQVSEADLTRSKMLDSSDNQGSGLKNGNQLLEYFDKFNKEVKDKQKSAVAGKLNDLLSNSAKDLMNELHMNSKGMSEVSKVSKARSDAKFQSELDTLKMFHPVLHRDIKSQQMEERTHKKNDNLEKLDDHAFKDAQEFSSIDGFKQSTLSKDQKPKEKAQQKAQPQLRIDKDVFKNISGNRSTHTFMVSDKVIKPNKIVDNLLPQYYLLNKRNATPDQVLPSAHRNSNAIQGHPLEFNRKISQIDEQSQSQRKKTKKYVDKYKDQY